MSGNQIGEDFVKSSEKIVSKATKTKSCTF
jgi:hypothetical protein